MSYKIQATAIIFLRASTAILGFLIKTDLVLRKGNKIEEENFLLDRFRFSTSQGYLKHLSLFLGFLDYLESPITIRNLDFEIRCTIC